MTIIEKAITHIGIGSVLASLFGLFWPKEMNEKHPFCWRDIPLIIVTWPLLLPILLLAVVLSELTED